VRSAQGAISGWFLSAYEGNPNGRLLSTTFVSEELSPTVNGSFIARWCLVVGRHNAIRKMADWSTDIMVSDTTHEEPR
jgi:hypothetical protein